MKSLLLLIATTTIFLSATAQEDKSKRPSPPATVTQTLEDGTVVTINYSQPSVKGRTIGKDLEPKEGKVWRAGANEATTFEVSKDVEVNDKKLPAGKYALFAIDNGKDWTIIFNKTWNQWGAYDYSEADDALRVTTNAGKGKEFSEKLTYNISKDGKVILLWGDKKVDFKVK
jgi:hypothetical protein